MRRDHGPADDRDAHRSPEVPDPPDSARPPDQAASPPDPPDSARPPDQAASPPDPPWPPRAQKWRHDAPDPPDSFPVPWTIWDGIGLMIWSIIAQALVVLPFLSAGLDLTRGPVTFGVLLAAQALTFVGIVAWLRVRGVLSWRLLGPLRPTWRHVWVGAGIGASGYVIVTLIVLIAMALFGPLEQPEQIVLQRLTESVTAMTLGFVAAVLFAPVLEELIFRAVLFQAFRHRAGLWPAIGISSFLFGLAHLELYPVPFFVVVLVIFGFWLAAAFHHTGSLVVPVVGHAVFNGIELMIAILVLPR